MEVPYHFFTIGGSQMDVVWVDSGQAVDESDEENNLLSFPKPNPTGCDEACIDTPTLRPTPPPESTQHASETPTLRPTPPPESTQHASATPTLRPTPPPESTQHASSTPTATGAPTPAERMVQIYGRITETHPDGCSQPIADVVVDFSSGEGDGYSTEATVEGLFELVLPQGRYKTRYFHPDYETLEEVEFVHSAGVQGVQVRLDPIEPRQPFDDPTTGFAGGVYGAGGSLVGGALLVFEREVDGLTRSVRSSTTGRYRIMVPRGRYYTSALHSDAGIVRRQGFSVLCEPGIHTRNFFLHHPATPTPTPDPNNPRCGDGQVDEGEDCEPSYGFCSGGCGARLCVDNGCRPDCTCPRLDIGGDSCVVDAFHDAGCSKPECAACVCETDPFCCETQWDPGCSSHARSRCEGVCL